MFPGGQLLLSDSGVYHMTSLKLEPQSSVIFAGGAPEIFVLDEIILRSSLGAEGFFLAHFGPSVQVEAPFTGDMLFAPNADMEIKANSAAHFVGRNVTVHQDVLVSTPLFSQRTAARLRPTATVAAAPQGEFSAPGLGAAEIGTAIMTSSQNSMCGATGGDRLFASFFGARLMHGLVSSIGTPGSLIDLSTNHTIPANVLPVPPPPSGCFGVPFPPNPLPVYPILPGGTAIYDDSPGVTGTDSVMVRLSGGKVAQVGFGSRFCDDPQPPTQANPCPTVAPGTLPTFMPCNPIIDSGVCSYAPDFSCTCVGPAGGQFGSWQCASRHRVESGHIGVRMSADCSQSWTAGTFDPSELGVDIDDGPGTVLPKGVDRPEAYFDPFDEKLYVSVRGLEGSGLSTRKVLIFAADTAGVTDASNLVFQQVRVDPPAGVTDPLIQQVAPPVVMTTVLEEKAPKPDGTTGRWVHFVTMHCNGAGRPVLDAMTPFGRRTWDLTNGGSDLETLCLPVAKGTAGMPFYGIHFGPSIVGISSVPPRVRVAYTGINDAGLQVVNVYSIELRSGQGSSGMAYDAPRIVNELSVGLPSSHAVFPQLIGVDHLANSSAQLDSAALLRFTVAPNTFAGTTISEWMFPVYSGIFGPALQLASWSKSTAFPGTDCSNPSTSVPECFAGDYRYGAFYQKVGASLSFLTPWTGASASSGSGVFAHAKIVTISP